MRATAEAKRRVRSGGRLLGVDEELEMIHLFEQQENEEKFQQPFVVPADVTGANLGTVRFIATIDDGGLLCALDATLWAQWERTLGPLNESRLSCVMGNGTTTKSIGNTVLHVNVDGVATRIEVEVIDSGGSFELLLGKPWLGRLKAVHNYGDDSIQVQLLEQEKTIHNKFDSMSGRLKTARAPQVPPDTPAQPTTHTAVPPIADQVPEETTEDIPTNDEYRAVLQMAERDTHIGGIEEVDIDPEILHSHKLVNQLRTPVTLEERFNEDRIKVIQESVTLGEHLSQEERSRIMNLLAEFADVFALQLSEVRPVNFVQHRIDVLPDAKLPLVLPSRPLTASQRTWLHDHIKKLLLAGIIIKIPWHEVRCVSSIVLAPKPVREHARSKDELKILANAACIDAGVPHPYPDSPTDRVLVPPRPPPKEVKWRLCNNFAALNKWTPAPPFPIGDLPRRQNQMAGFQLYNVLDLAMGYHSCMIREKDWGLAAFKVEDMGHYAYIRMPFGLTGSPTTFCEMMANVFGDMIGHDMENYIDDICQGGHSFNDLFTKFRKILVRCRETGLVLAPSKLFLFCKTVVWAGVELSAAGLSPDISKVSAIVEWPRPTTAHETLAFLSTIGHFRSCMSKFALVADPLYEMVRGVRVVKTASKKRGAYKEALQSASLVGKWGEEQEKSFARLKAMLTEAPVLVPIENGKPVVVGTDASKEGFAAYLAQHRSVTDSTGITREVLHPIAFASRHTATSEHKVHSFELEAKAIKWAFDKFHKYIWGQSIILKTDCKAVKDLLSNKSLPPTHARYKEAILGYDIVDFIHQEGKTNPADGMSRSGLPPAKSALDPVDPGWEARLGIVNDMYTIKRHPLLLLQPDEQTEQLQKRFKDDATRGPILQWLMHLQLPEDSSPRERETIKKRAEEYLIKEGKLWRLRKGSDRPVECLTREEGREVTLKTHMSIGHWARDILTLELRFLYDWPELRHDASEVPSRCANCQQFGPRLRNFLLQPIIRLHPFDLLAADYLKMPRGTGGFTELLVFVDFFTRFIWGFMLKKPGSNNASATALRNICLEWKAPKRLLTDGGSHFKGRDMDAVLKDFNIEHETTPAYSAHVNGLIENENKQVLAVLGKECATEHPGEEEAITTSWPKKLPRAISQINERRTPVLNTSPKSLMFGTTEDHVDIDDLIELDFDQGARLAFLDADREVSREHFRRIQERRRDWFNKKSRPVTFEPGDLVLVHNSKLDTSREAKYKLSAPWLGPLMIDRRNNNSYYLKSLSGRHASGRVHAHRLKKFKIHEESVEERLESEEALAREEAMIATLDDIADTEGEDLPFPDGFNEHGLIQDDIADEGAALQDMVDEVLDEDLHLPIAQRMGRRRAAEANPYIHTKSRRGQSSNA